MNRTQSFVLRMTAFLLLSGALIAQVVGSSPFQRLANGTGNSPVLQADGPAPPPPPTPIKQSQS